MGMVAEEVSTEAEVQEATEALNEEETTEETVTEEAE